MLLESGYISLAAVSHPLLAVSFRTTHRLPDLVQRNRTNLDSIHELRPYHGLVEYSR